MSAIASGAASPSASTSRTLGWTGGQYSAYRVALGLVALAVASRTNLEPRVAHELGAALEWTLRGIGAACAFAIALGRWDRTATLTAFALLAAGLATASFRLRQPMNLLAGLFVLHACMPRAPFGSLDARARADPAGGWALTSRASAILRFGWAVWVCVPSAYLVHAACTVESANFEAVGGERARAFLFAAGAANLLLLPLAPFHRERGWFFALVVVELACVVALGTTIGSAISPLELAVRLLSLAFFFDPAWIRPRTPGVVERVFYDGECGLCQRAVRFLLAEDPHGSAFRFAPLQGPTATREIASDVRAALPDSIVVLTSDRRVLVRSSAVVHVLERLGGLWRVLGTILALVPRPLRDLGYDAIARIRKRIFAAPKALCPIGPKHVTQRFDP